MKNFCLRIVLITVIITFAFPSTTIAEQFYGLPELLYTDSFYPKELIAHFQKLEDATDIPQKIFYEPITIAGTYLSHDPVTDLSDPEDDRKDYSYSEDGLLQSISYFKLNESNSAYKLIKKENFVWQKNETAKPVLLRFFIENPDQIVFDKSFEYNTSGHLVREKTLSLKENRVESSFTRYSYEHDKLVSKLVFQDHTLVKRFFYHYDANHILFEEIEDNGSSKNEQDLNGVTVKRSLIKKRRLGNLPGICGVVTDKKENLCSGEVQHARKYYKIYDKNKKLVREDIQSQDPKENASWFYQYNSNGDQILKTYSKVISRTSVYNSAQKRWECKVEKEGFHIACSYDESGRILREEKRLLDRPISYAPVKDIPKEYFSEFYKKSQQLPSDSKWNSKFGVNKDCFRIYDPLPGQESPSFRIEVTLTGDQEYDDALLQLWEKHEEKAREKIRVANEEYQQATVPHIEIFKRFWKEFYLFDTQVWNLIGVRRSEEQVKEFRKLAHRVEWFLHKDLALSSRIKEYWLPSGCLHLCDVRKGFAIIYERMNRAAQTCDFTLGSFNNINPVKSFGQMYREIRDAEVVVMAKTVAMEKLYEDFLKTLRLQNPYEFEITFAIASRFYQTKAEIYKEQLVNFWNEVLDLNKELGSYAAGRMSGNLLLDKGNYIEAYQTLKEALVRLVENYAIDDGDWGQTQYAEIHHLLGFCIAENNAFTQAIKHFTESIEQNPKASEAYLERAAAHFENGNPQAALADYHMYSEEEDVAWYLPINERMEMYEFTESLMGGVVTGANKAAHEFVPTLLKTPQALGQFAWSAVTDSPQWVSELGLKVYDFFDHLYTADRQTITEELIYPLYEFGEKWTTISNQEKGQIIGSVIGQYGFDIFAGTAALKGIQAVKQFHEVKKLNKIATFVETPVMSTEEKVRQINALQSQHFFNQSLDASYIGEVIAGAGHEKKIKDIRRVVAMYGGDADRWVKKVTNTYYRTDSLGNPLPKVKLKNGKLVDQVISCHWYEDIKTKKRYEIKTKLFDDGG